jgi:phage gp36-like protein
MGRYINWGDVVTKYKNAAQDYGAEATAGGAFIAEAEDEIDARLAGRYVVPFVPGSSNAPGILRGIAVDLAYYKMYWQQDTSDKLYDYINDRLNGIATGSITLVTSGGAVVPQAILTAWTDHNYRSAFGPDRVEDFSVSSSWQSDEWEKRRYD